MTTSPSPRPTFLRYLLAFRSVSLGVGILIGNAALYALGLRDTALGCLLHSLGCGLVGITIGYLYQWGLPPRYRIVKRRSLCNGQIAYFAARRDYLFWYEEMAVNSRSGRAWEWSTLEDCRAALCYHIGMECDRVKSEVIPFNEGDCP